MKNFTICIILLFLSGNAWAEEIALANLPLMVLASKQEDDIESLKRYRAGLLFILKYMGDRSDLFPPKRMYKPPCLVGNPRKDAIDLWNRWMDHYLALDSVYAFHKDFGQLKNGALKNASFHISQATLYMEYRFALDFIAACENNPALDPWFNEMFTELGLPRGTYANFKYRFLNLLKAGEFGAFEVLTPLFGAPDDKTISQWITEDRSKIWGYGEGQGPKLTFENAMAIFGNAGRDIFFPVQKGVAEWMGHTKVYRIDQFLINQEQIKILQYFLQPGDLLLERREWYLSNIGLPGFWTHAALYIGSPEQRETYFAEPETIIWVQRQGAETFEKLLQNSHPAAYTRSMKNQDDGYRPRVIEAIGEGVIFTTLEFSAACDSLAILRPKVPKKDKAVAVLKAFEYIGRPYDYDFDFLTDNALVCTELIYKVYRPGQETAGLRLPTDKIMGRYLLTPNAIAKHFSDTYHKLDRQMDFVLFLDGYEKEIIALQADISSFLESWKRPKWHIVMQDAPN